MNQVGETPFGSHSSVSGGILGSLLAVKRFNMASPPGNSGGYSWTTMFPRLAKYSVLILMLALCVMPDSCCGWEFSVEAEFVWRNWVVSQFGPQGFFGGYDVDNSSAGGNYASCNSWVGSTLHDLSSSSGASEQNMETNIQPELRINQAMRLRGYYRLGAYGDPVGSAYINSMSPGVQVAISEGQWTMWWFSAQTPWGTLLVGKRPFEFGCGLQYNGAEDLTSESLLLVAPAGPFRVGFGFYPWRRQPENAFRQDQPNNSFPNPPDNPYYNPGDLSATLSVSPTVFVTYEAGPLSLGVVVEYYRYHRGPESQRLQADRASFPPSDVVSTDGGLFFKYFNGRFFFNTELDWVNKTTVFQRSLNGTFLGVPDRADGSGSMFAPRYIEAWRWMVQTGLVTGPVRASLLYAWMPGPDRRHGVLIDRQPYFYGFANYGVVGPYSRTLGFFYGSGLGLYNFNTNGYINDATILALRLDYAVAANMNTYVSFLWADRQSPQGYGWGFIRPAPTGSTVEFLNLATINAANTGVPSIPDSNLGWEVDVGIDWRLLEKWSAKLMVGYWQPGRWFNYACVDKGVANWDNPSPANRFGINPQRVIAPVVGVNFKIVVEL